MLQLHLLVGRVGRVGYADGREAGRGARRGHVARRDVTAARRHVIAARRRVHAAARQEG